VASAVPQTLSENLSKNPRRVIRRAACNLEKSASDILPSIDIHKCRRVQQGMTEGCQSLVPCLVSFAIFHGRLLQLQQCFRREALLLVIGGPGESNPVGLLDLGPRFSAGFLF